jgi:DNA-binding Lrp family transcriptional regulator
VKKKVMKLVLELLKDSKKSDRELAKVLGVSQPTVSRTRSRLVKEGIIRDFTVIPDFAKIGYKILAITLIKAINAFASNEYTDMRKEGLEWLAKQPNIIMGGACEGMGMNVFVISLHKNYSDHAEFMLKHRREMGHFIDDLQTFLVDLNGKERLKPLGLKYLAEKE